MCVRRFGGERYEVYHDGQFKVVIDNDEDTVTEPVIVVSRERV